MYVSHCPVRGFLCSNCGGLKWRCGVGSRVQIVRAYDRIGSVRVRIDIGIFRRTHRCCCGRWVDGLLRRRDLEVGCRASAMQIARLSASLGGLAGCKMPCRLQHGRPHSESMAGSQKAETSGWLQLFTQCTMSTPREEQLDQRCQEYQEPCSKNLYAVPSSSERGCDWQ